MESQQGRSSCRFVSWSILFLVASLVVSTSLFSAENISGEKTLYGNDNRHEPFQTTRALCRASTSVAAMFPKDQLEKVENGYWKASMPPATLAHEWCEDERFSAQPVGATCSAFLIAEDRIATAAHCLNEANDPWGSGLDCENALFIFDYQLRIDGELPTSFNALQAYSCAEVQAGEESPIGADWRVARLERKTQRTPLTLYTGSQPLPEQWAINVLGHPLGLPMKVATNGKMLATSMSSAHFMANIDTYEGNSGSPVVTQFNGNIMVLGLVSSGAQDSVESKGERNRSCKRSVHCNNGSCSGERVTRSTIFANWAQRTQNTFEQTNAGETLCPDCTTDNDSLDWLCAP